MRRTPEGVSYRGRPYASFAFRDLVAGYRARYPECYANTLEYEGGYVNDPYDPGGCTNRGITIGTLQTWRGDPSVTCTDVMMLSEAETALIYTTNYWAPVWGSYLPVGINCQAFDFGVNAGPSRAVRILQECVGAAVDGIMGPETWTATVNTEQDALLTLYHDKRQGYYESLSTFDTYGTGWTRRNDDCLALSQSMLDAGPVDLPRLPDPLEARVSAIEAWARSFPGAPD